MGLGFVSMLLVWAAALLVVGPLLLPTRRGAPWAALILVNCLVDAGAKRAVGVGRPYGSGRTSYGMPSGHAQAAAFPAIAVTAGLWVRSVKWAAPRAWRSLGAKRRVWATTAAWARASALAAAAARVMLARHPVAQVLAGAVFGASLGMLVVALLGYAGGVYGGGGGGGGLWVVLRGGARAVAWRASVSVHGVSRGDTSCENL